MPTHHETPLRVFYSWQTDLPEAVNLKLIRNALTQAGNEINADHDSNLHVIIDEATREIPGSPNIADSIFTKIRNADVFVCDLTKAAEVRNEAGVLRKYCNPNVALELGYAVRTLGWNRIIIVFNDAYGIIPDDLPFDARGHRTSSYKCQAELDAKGKPTSACQSAISNASGHLRTILTSALNLIAKENPKRPIELEANSQDEVRRERDLEQLEKLFYWLHLGVLDNFIDRLGYGCLTVTGTVFFEQFSRLVGTSKFHINDSELRPRIERFHKAWEECFRYAHSMDRELHDSEAHFSMPGDMFQSKEQEKEFHHTADQAEPFRVALDSLLNYVREKFLEIDPNTSGEEAFQRWNQMEKERAQRL